MTNRLQWEVFVSAQIPVVTSDLPPGASEMKWSPIASTLILGKRDAVLVDTAITVEQNQKLAEWIAASRKNLTMIYATHGHGDHFFGVNTLQKAFPKARFVATREVIAVMRKQASVPVVDSYWKPRFPGQIDSTLVVADELTGGVIELEGEQLVSVPLGHTDTDSTTCLHVSSIGLVACGDALYNDVHLHLGESNAEGRIAAVLRYHLRSLLKPQLAAISFLLFCPARGRPLAHRDSHKGLRGSPSCHTTDGRHRRAHRRALLPARKSLRPGRASPFPS
jgi:glyoxylase-like metal-dependent hydrolase (beta-lactamase superfamily II)